MNPALLVPLVALALTQSPAQEPPDFRWAFGNTADAAWVAQHEEKLEAIDGWWKAFEAYSPELEKVLQGQHLATLEAWMQEHLASLDPEIMWEFGPGLRGGYRLVLTPESLYSLRPLVTTLIERAPELPGWEFYGYRLPENVDLLEAILRARGQRSLEDTRVVVKAGVNHIVDFEFQCPDFKGPDDEDARSAAFVALETLLGEHDLNVWVGYIDVAKGDGASGVELKDLRFAFTDVVDSIQADLPERPLAEESLEDASWTMWEPKRQADLIVASSPLPAMWSVAHSGSVFSSERFSKNHETFCYVKLQIEESPESDTRLEQRSHFEDALIEALSKDSLGALVGNGTGLRYSYIELALTDVNAGIEVVQRVLRELDAPKRSWLLFFDAIYQDEWVGIFDETPAPPR